MKNKQVKFLKQLLETPSATGTEIAVAELVRERLAGTADEIQTDVMGSVHARLSGTGVAPSLMLSAHMDEIGLMVTYISDEGFLSVSSVGGVDAAILPGMRVDVHASNSFEPLRGVVAVSYTHLDVYKRQTPWTSPNAFARITPERARSTRAAAFPCACSRRRRTRRSTRP